MVNIVIALIVIVAVSILIIKKYKSQTVLLAGALVLMLAAYLLGYKAEFVPVKQSLGLPVFDMFEYIAQLTSKDAAHLGLMIMAITGFAKYMDYIGASATLVQLAMGPLGRLQAPYLVMSLSFLVCMVMALFIASASGLAMLMMVTIFPILVRLGVSRLGAASVVSTGHLLDIGPSSATTALVAKTADISVGSFFVNYQLKTYIICGIVTAITHYFWQKYLDRKEEHEEGTAHVAVSAQALDGMAPPGPKLYAVLPLLPLFFLLGCGEYGIKSLKMTVVTAMFLSLVVSMLFECLRSRNIKKTFAGIQAFFKGMGDQFTMTVTLIVAGESFAYGLQSIGVVDQIIKGSQSAGLPAAIVVVTIAGILVFFSLVMGSGVAPMFAFTPLLPNIAQGIGANLPAMLLTVQNSASLGRLLSPITAVVVAVAGIANVSPVELVKRNSVPVAVAIIASMACSMLLY